MLLDVARSWVNRWSCTFWRYYYSYSYSYSICCADLTRSIFYLDLITTFLMQNWQIQNILNSRLETQVCFVSIKNFVFLFGDFIDSNLSLFFCNSFIFLKFSTHNSLNFQLSHILTLVQSVGVLSVRYSGPNNKTSVINTLCMNLL